MLPLALVEPNSRVHAATDVEPFSGVVTPSGQELQELSGPMLDLYCPSGHKPTIVGCCMYDPAGTTAGSKAVRTGVRAVHRRATQQQDDCEVTAQMCTAG
jgi:hypothetical protein